MDCYGDYVVFNNVFLIKQKNGYCSILKNSVSLKIEK